MIWRSFYTRVSPNWTNPQLERNYTTEVIGSTQNYPACQRYQLNGVFSQVLSTLLHSTWVHSALVCLLCINWNSLHLSSKSQSFWLFCTLDEPPLSHTTEVYGNDHLAKSPWGRGLMVGGWSARTILNMYLWSHICSTIIDIIWTDRGLLVSIAHHTPSNTLSFHSVKHDINFNELNSSQWMMLIIYNIE